MSSGLPSEGERLKSRDGRKGLKKPLPSSLLDEGSLLHGSSDPQSANLGTSDY